MTGPVKAFVVAGKDLLVAARDTKGLIMLLLMPFLLVAVLGFSLRGLVSAGPLPVVEPFDLGIVDHDGGDLPRSFRSLLETAGLAGLARPVELSEAQARDLISRGDLAGAVVFPESYSAKVRAGACPVLPVLLDAGQGFGPRVVRIIAQEFSDGLFAVQVATRAAVSRESGLPGVDQASNMAVIAAEAGSRIAAMTGAPTEEMARGGAPTTSFQYYAAAMSVMFLLFAGQSGLESMTGERRQMTLVRILAAPGAARGFVAGKFLGVLAVAFTQFLILLTGTRLAFGVDWGPSLLAVLAIGLGYAAAIAGLAVMVSALVHNGKAATTWWVLATQAFSALGGSLWPLAFFPPILERLASFLPNYWALRALLGAMTGDGLAQAAPSALAMAGFGLAALLVASARLARV